MKGLLIAGDKKIKFKIRIYIVKNGNLVAGEGLIKILTAVDKYGSMRRASIKLKINYKKLWLKIATTEEKLGIKLINRRRGKRGCSITDEAKSIINQYKELTRCLSELM